MSQNTPLRTIFCSIRIRALASPHESIKGAPGRFEAPRYINKPAEPPGGFGVASWPNPRTWVLGQFFYKIVLAAEYKGVGTN